mgnify:CR=1 FL=1
MTRNKVAIIGSGNIGTDLMIKVLRLSQSLEMGAMVGIDPASDGLARAARMGVPTVSTGVDGLLDVALQGGRIAAVGKGLAAGAKKVRDVSGCVVTPGLIDIHTHVYHKATSLSVDPGFIARRSACTTLVDAGSAGAGNYDGFPTM